MNLIIIVTGRLLNIQDQTTNLLFSGCSFKFNLLEKEGILNRTDYLEFYLIYHFFSHDLYLEFKQHIIFREFF